MIKSIINQNPKELGSLTLAYLGDALYEIYIRNHVVALGGRPNALHRKTISYVSAKAQARIIHYILPSLSEEEQAIVKKGRNAKSSTIPKNADVIDYRYSTAFEALLGYLYLNNKIDRVEEIIKSAIEYIDRSNNDEQRK